MPIRLYNTLTRSKDEFVPLDPPNVRMYTCGPTVYSYAHVGNLRTFMFQDLLRKHLKYRGYNVTLAMNITDVEDKIIRTCRESGESLKSLTNRYADAFLQDLDALGVDRPDHMPRATEFVDEMVAMIETLTERGHTYEIDGSVYFKIATFPEYGKLSHFDLDTLQSGASGRVDSDEYKTEDARDFALWKAYDEDDGPIYWETPIGKGRPGWHLECSCMSMHYLGESFDIHCGAVDLIFPHHENEIAQSEATTGKPFVRYWVHAAHLNIDGRKISKSLGNTITLRDLLDQGHDPLTIRYALRSTHYRQPTNFSAETLEMARNTIQKIQEFRARLNQVRGNEGESIAEAVGLCEREFAEALDDDLNISGALASVFDFIRDTNRLIDRNELSEVGAQSALGLLDRLDAVTGLFGEQKAAVPQNIQDLVAKRQQARRTKNFAEADAIRDTLAESGWVVKDTPDGPRVTRV